MTDIGLKRQYRLRIPVPGRRHIVVAVPYEVVAREAEKCGETVERFVISHAIIAEYDNFDGILYTFKEDK